jgi:hypothetical protein
MERKIGFGVLAGQGANIDTTTAGGRLVLFTSEQLPGFHRRGRARAQWRPAYTMTLAKLRLAQAAMSDRDVKVGDLCKELGVTRQTLYRFVGPKGELRSDGAKLLARKRPQAHS